MILRGDLPGKTLRQEGSVLFLVSYSCFCFSMSFFTVDSKYILFFFSFLSFSSFSFSFKHLSLLYFDFPAREFTEYMTTLVLIGLSDCIIHLNLYDMKKVILYTPSLSCFMG